MAMVNAYQPGSSTARSMGAGGGSTGNKSEGKEAVKELREDSRAVSKGALEGAAETRKELKGSGPGMPSEGGNTSGGSPLTRGFFFSYAAFPKAPIGMAPVVPKHRGI